MIEMTTCQICNGAVPDGDHSDNGHTALCAAVMTKMLAECHAREGRLREVLLTIAEGQDVTARIAQDVLAENPPADASYEKPSDDPQKYGIVAPPGPDRGTTARGRVILNLRYWLDHNTFHMGEHDLRVLRGAITELKGG